MPDSTPCPASLSGVPHEVGFEQSEYTVLEGESVAIVYGIFSDPSLLAANDFVVFDIMASDDTATGEDTNTRTCTHTHSPPTNIHI